MAGIMEVRGKLSRLAQLYDQRSILISPLEGMIEQLQAKRDEVAAEATTVIVALEKEICADTLEIGETIYQAPKGPGLMATHRRGSLKWDRKAVRAYTVDHPEVAQHATAWDSKAMRKIAPELVAGMSRGKSSVSIRMSKREGGDEG